MDIGNLISSFMQMVQPVDPENGGMPYVETDPVVPYFTFKDNSPSTFSDGTPRPRRKPPTPDETLAANQQNLRISTMRPLSQTELELALEPMMKRINGQ